MKNLKKLFVFTVMLAVSMLCGCGDSAKTNDKKTCESSDDCSLGFVCNTVTKTCEKKSGSDGSDTSDDSDSGEKNDDGSDTSDSGNDGGDDDGDSGNNGKSGITCDCNGEEYNIPNFAAKAGKEWCNEDEDGDGIPNCIEVPRGIPVDTDEDGTPDYKTTDADSDGIPDSAECPELPCRDTDADGLPDYRDDDSDGDNIPDKDECLYEANGNVCSDFDEDGIPDYLDTDSDNDGLPDRIESNDAINDGAPCYTNPDCDGDGIPDSEECPDYEQNQKCSDANNNKIPDFKETDSDGDGLPDNQEVDCGGALGHSKLKQDTDNDGYSDLAEVLVGSDPCDKESGVKDAGVKFYFELPYKGEKQNDTLVFSPQVQKADIFFNVDTTSSMGEEIAKLKDSLSTVIIPGIKAKITDSAFGVSYFDDFPITPYGSGSDQPFGLLQSPTTDVATAQAGVNKLKKHSGNDLPESGYESLYKIATGAELKWNGGSVAEGGVGFREGAIPIVFHITDAAAHDSNNTPYSSSKVYTIFSQSQVIEAMNAIGAKVVSVVSEGGETTKATNQLTTVSNETGAVVPSCANAGRTTLLYTIKSNGSNLDSSAVNGVDALIKYASFDVRVEPAADLNDPSLDTSCFLKKVEALEYIPVDDCAATIVATPQDFSEAGYNNGFSNFSTGTSTAGTPGNKLTFNVEAMNDCFPQEKEAKMFKAYINVIDNKTGSVLDTQPVTIIVPAKANTENY